MKDGKLFINYNFIFIKFYWGTEHGDNDGHFSIFQGWNEKFTKFHAEYCKENNNVFTLSKFEAGNLIIKSIILY